MVPRGTRTRGPRAALVCAVVVAAAVALTGCSTSGAGAERHGGGRAGSKDLPAQNIERWVLPLDAYLVGNTKNSDYAQSLLVQPCMERSGYSWDVPYRDTTATDGPSWNSVERRLFTPALAERWGFHLAPSPDTTLGALKVFIARANAVPPAEAAVVSKCVIASRKELPPLSGAAQLGAGYASEAYSGALTESAVKAAAKKWRTCMTPAGVSDLPATPEQFPSPSVVSEFSIQLDLSNTPPRVSPAEIRLATFEAKCETSSGYQSALYRAEWTGQVRLLRRNADALERSKKQLDQYDARVQKVISSHAPKH